MFVLLVICIDKAPCTQKGGCTFYQKTKRLTRSSQSFQNNALLNVSTAILRSIAGKRQDNEYQTGNKHRVCFCNGFANKGVAVKQEYLF
jgi:hypothetical protein